MFMGLVITDAPCISSISEREDSGVSFLVTKIQIPAKGIVLVGKSETEVIVTMSGSNGFYSKPFNSLSICFPESTSL